MVETGKLGVKGTSRTRATLAIGFGADTSAAPLGWSHAQFVRLAWSIRAGHPVAQPSIVACRYVKSCP